MSEQALSCPKCKGKDVADQFVVASRCVEGAPQKVHWLLCGSGGRIKVTAEIELVPIATFRCHSCGFLESYAREEFAAK